MLTLVFFAAVTFCSVSYLFILPIVRYFHDPKGLRKYPGFSPLLGFTDLRHIYLSACGYRSKELYEAHRRAPILRTGPNSLSFGDTQAIKDIYGHSTPCLKDLNYMVLGGSHTHLFDVVDKSDHARQRKTLSAAFAIKNLERWVSKVAQTTARLLKAMEAHCTAPLPPGQTIPNPADVTLDFNKWVYLFTIEAINNIALSSTIDLLDQGTDEVTAQKKDGTVYRARYREAQAQTAYAQSVFVWDYKHYSWLARLSKLHPKWRARAAVSVAISRTSSRRSCWPRWCIGTGLRWRRRTGRLSGTKRSIFCWGRCR